ncbi:MAG: MGMT family protein [Bacteroidota bacterium]|nr:MGMT family protein [Bacteroidota bacterium]
MIPKEKESFFEKVFDVVMQVPYGRVTSYGAVAKYLGSGKSARLVGWAMNASITAKNRVPAHRVVNRNGQLTGKHHFGGENIMQQLLESEGIEIIDDQIQNFDKYYWDPIKELF